MESSLVYFKLSDQQVSFLKEKQQQQEALYSEYATKDCNAVRRFQYRDNTHALRTNFGVDIDKILHNVFYNRYADKTQVFSFYRNDDLTRRALHVQLVARISKVIGAALGLNLDLIEAIALGHDIGHTPFGHKGEQYLSELYKQHTGKVFMHNLHSVRILKDLTNTNLTLQTYDGILCHCGEKGFMEYAPAPFRKFDEFIDLYENCYLDPSIMDHIKPTTLEGCVVRVSDMIAYVGKDRQDAYKINLLTPRVFSETPTVGNSNKDIINRLVANIIKNSLGKDRLIMDEQVFNDLILIKNENSDLIYQNETVCKMYNDVVRPMMQKLYLALFDDLCDKNQHSTIYTHHIHHPLIGHCYSYDNSNFREGNVTPDYHQVVVDYIASMTDDYFIDLFKLRFPEDELNNQIRYVSYFTD